MRARVSADDLKGGSLVKPAFFLLQVTKYEEKPGSADPSSTTAHITMTVICDSQGSEDYKGARCMIFPNEKSLGIPPNPSFLVALGAKVTENGIDANLNDSIRGRYVEAYLNRGKDTKNNRDTNAAQEFFPIGTNIKEEILAKYGVPLPKKQEAVKA